MFLVLHCGVCGGKGGGERKRNTFKCLWAGPGLVMWEQGSFSHFSSGLSLSMCVFLGSTICNLMVVTVVVVVVGGWLAVGGGGGGLSHNVLGRWDGIN